MNKINDINGTHDYMTQIRSITFKIVHHIFKNSLSFVRRIKHTT